MTFSQKRASDPKTSVWVSASAGTGKTKVLVDRLIHILYSGTPIRHIVCLTFTKAAAVEMQERLLKRLQQDAAKESKVNNNESNTSAPSFAAKIYEELLESPESLKIMTLHGYCQSLLQKFPFEAGVTPFFDVLDDDNAYQLLMESLNHVLQSPETEEIACAIEGVSDFMGEYTFENCLMDAFSRWHKVRHLERAYENPELYKSALLDAFPLDLDEALDPGIQLTSLIDALSESTQNMDKTLATALASDGLLPNLFLTKEGKPRKKIISADFKKKNADMAEELDAYAHYVHQKSLVELHANWITANKNFWQIVQAVLTHFGMLKAKKGVLDYHDLILHSLALFSDDLALAFVHQRLDYTIDHILVDESQDNSPEQWLFILKLVDLFIREDTPNRSLFVVGDVKQSIYGFQGAVPHLFESLVYTFEHTLKSRGHRFERLTLDDSFRTVSEILQTVDNVFNKMRNGMGAYTKHRAFRRDAGWVGTTLLTKVDFKAEETNENQETDTKEGAWPIITQYEAKTSKDSILAEHVADDIQKALNERWLLPSVNRAVEAKDVLILLRSRGSLAAEIIRALKQRNIAVEGPDRIQLNTRLAIQDVMCMLRFLCLPQDDMSLAHVLKSPFANDGHGFDEATLFELCYNREGSLWQELSRSADPDHVKMTTLLKDLLARVDYDAPSFLIRAMIEPAYSAFLNRLGSDVHLLFESLLNTVMDIEKGAPTLAEVLFKLEKSMPIVKRDPTAPTGVRIMTIHGSKGLEAPFVVLVDRDERIDLAKENLLWPKIDDQNSGEIIELFCLKPKSALTIESILALRENAMDTMREERNRLLYVALTRPRDALLVVGSGPWTELIDECIQIQGDTVSLQKDTTHADAITMKLDQPLPEWMHQKYNEKTQKSILFDEPEIQTAAMKRGEMIHRLIEALTKTTRDRWNTVLTYFKEDGVAEADLIKVSALAHNPEFSHLFNNDYIRAWSEIEVVSNGTLHRIDRLIETNEAFLIVDFKTGEQRNVQGYRDQLATYKTAISPMIGAKPVRTYLFWTDALVLEEVKAL
ncbi:MAG: UvrD-helicase domain-containing protein [Candidatus Paracaedibacteraceae bacterium]|nr:UvrD-helicase domain-containing protein [Candidatus Paracaedibacteraceae bacterium]